MSEVSERLSDGVLSLRLERPERLNALTTPMLTELGQALERARERSVRVVTITGSGSSFCAGADVEESLGLEGLDEAEAMLEALADVLRAISSLPKPVVVGLHGHAAGGGAEIALEADLRVVAEGAQLWFPDVAVGSTPASAWRLVRMVGTSVAAQMVLAGRRLDADELERLGLAHSRVQPPELGDSVIALAGELRDRGGPRPLGLAKRALSLAAEADRETDLRANVAAMLACFMGTEQRGAVERFATRKRR